MKKQFSEKRPASLWIDFYCCLFVEMLHFSDNSFFYSTDCFLHTKFFSLRFVFHSAKDPHFFIFYTSFSAPSFFILIQLTFVSFKAGVGAISFFTKYRVTKPHEVSWLLMHSPQNLHTLFSVCLWSCESCLLRTQTLGKRALSSSCLACFEL